MLWEKIDVVIDRPLGSAHPDDPACIYPLNYGYVPGIMANDGEEQDVYVMGVDTPLEHFSGRVIAVIHRKDDHEDKWVAAPVGTYFSLDEIRQATHFIEQYFDSEIVCIQGESAASEERMMLADEPGTDDLGCVTIAARYEGKWIFCREKDRDQWKMPTDFRLKGENAFDAAHRVLRQQVGAVEFICSPVAPYAAADRALLFFAEIAKMGSLPENSDTEEIILNDHPPRNLVHPQVFHALFARLQAWLNLQTKADEIWDVYDVNRRLTGRTHRRGDYLTQGDYHLVVDAWIRRSDGRLLITKRSPNKGYPGMWEITGGSAVTGDDSLAAALREVQEETGLKLHPENGRLVMQYTRRDSHKDVWLFLEDFNIEDVVLQEGETCDKRAVTLDELQTIEDEDMFVPISYFEEMMTLMREEC